MNTYDKFLIINKAKYLSGEVEDFVWLSNIDDIIKYGQTNSKCYYGQLVATKNNQGIKYYIMVFDTSDKFYHKLFTPLCLSELIKRGLYDYKGYYTIKPRLSNLTSSVTFSLPDKTKYYKIFLNTDFITDYLEHDEEFITTPFIFSSENEVLVYCYDENKTLIDKYKMIHTVNEANLITGVLINDIL